jgi:hypothetical protein
LHADEPTREREQLHEPPLTRALRELERAFDLEAARDAVQAPLDEMLAVVVHQVIAILAEARARAADHLGRVIHVLGVAHHEHRATLCELRHAGLLDRPAIEPVYASVVVDHAART